MANWALFLALSATVCAQERQPPPLLSDVLDRRQDLRLLDPSVDLPGGYTIDEIKDFGFWPPWIVVDLDHDGRPDVVAAVVRVTSKGTQFGVLAVHARTPAVLHWVVPLGAEPLNGVSSYPPGADTVMPLYCIECDANSWYRWNGHSYEARLHAVGDTVVIASHDMGRALGTFALPSRRSRFSAGIERCAEAKVRQVHGTSHRTRWYLLEVQSAPALRGWVPASLVEEDECVG
jgi:hypothetical protein